MLSYLPYVTLLALFVPTSITHKFLLENFQQPVDAIKNFKDLTLSLVSS